MSGSATLRLAISNPRRVWGGTSTVACDLARGLAGRGHRVSVLCRPGSMLERELGPELAVPVLHGTKFPPPTIVSTLAWLRRAAVDVLLSMTAKDRRVSVPAARAAGVPAVAHWAAVVPVGSGYQGWCDRLPSHYVAISRATREILERSAPDLPAARISLIPNGVDIDRFAVARRVDLGLPDDAVVVGYVGRLDEEKGVEELAKAWRTVAPVHPDAHLVIVGRGDGERVRGHLGDAPRAHFLGFRRDVPEVLKALDIVVVPSRTEAFGIAAAEAMAAGRPVVATRVGGLPEIVRDGIDGILVPQRESTALAEALGRLIAEPDARARLGAAGMERIRSGFSWSATLDAYEALFARLAEARTRDGS